MPSDNPFVSAYTFLLLAVDVLAWQGCHTGDGWGELLLDMGLRRYLSSCSQKMCPRLTPSYIPLLRYPVAAPWNRSFSSRWNLTDGAN